MISWNELKQRRITQVVLTYVAVGWMALAGVDQVVDREVLPEIVYRLALLVYAGGVPAALILGWYHGEKGRQQVTVLETVLLAVVFVVTGVAGVGVVRSYNAAQSVLPRGALNALYDPRRVAVLYFDDFTGSDDLGHVADGLTEALIDELDRIGELDVVSRNGVSPYRGTEAVPDEVGRELNAGSVIWGSVERAGERLRVSVRLVDTESGVDMGRTSFALPEEDLLAARDSLTTRSAQFLRERLGEEVRVRERRAGTDVVEAWTHVQRAERLRKDAREASLDDADEALTLLIRSDSLLRAAESLDPSWTEPTALRADVALQRAVGAHAVEDALEAIRSGVELAERSVERDPNHAGAWEALGTLRHFHWFLNVSPTQQERTALLDAAQSDLERAVDLDATLASALNRLSQIYYYERADAIRGALTARQALLADSYLRDAPRTLDRLFWAHYDLGQFAEAGRTCREAAARFAEDFRFTQCELWMMITPTVDPDPATAWTLQQRIDSLAPPAARAFQNRVARTVVGGVLARANLPDSARSVLIEARAGPEIDPGQELPGYEAIMWAILGDRDEAVRQLMRYVSANPDHRRFQVQGDLHWWWRALRDHPEFSALATPGA